jgi:hypothetical protein
MDKDFSCIIYTTECPIQRPCKILQQIFYSGKKKRHTLKYEIGISVHTGLIVWIGGGVSGSNQDLTIAKEELMQVHEDRIFIGDKGYVGHERILTPLKTPQRECEELWNSILGKLRVPIEHVFGRIKIFHCLNVPWRHNILYHPIVFHVITNFVNFDLIFYPIKA